MPVKSMLDQQMDPNKFDYRVHLRDNSGTLLKTNYYTKYVRNGEEILERPIQSGNLWTEGNQPWGRIERKDGVAPAFIAGAPHIAYEVPLTGDDALKYQLEQEKRARAAAEAELAEYRKDNAAKIEPKKAQVKP